MRAVSLVLWNWTERNFGATSDRLESTTRVLLAATIRSANRVPSFKTAVAGQKITDDKSNETPLGLLLMQKIYTIMRIQRNGHQHDTQLFKLPSDSHPSNASKHKQKAKPISRINGTTLVLHARRTIA